RGQAGEAPLEFRATSAVAGDENHEVGESSAGRGRFPSADAFFEPHDGLDRDVKVLVFRPARRTHDEPEAAAAQPEAREQRLAKALALRSIDRREDLGRPIVEDTRVRHAETCLEK